MDIRYLGHSAFEFSHNNNQILVDPYITINNYNWHERNITDIFLTHAHSDHLGQAVEIAKEKNAKITAVFELANYCREQGCNVNPVNLGGRVVMSDTLLQSFLILTIPEFIMPATPACISK